MSNRKFGCDRHEPPGDWARASHYLKAVGVHHRRSSAKQFADAVREAERRKRKYGIRLVPEPENPHDRNAIRLIGHCEVARLFGGVALKEWHVGYVDRETAERLNSNFVSKGAKLEGELYGIYVSDEGYIDINYFALSEPETIKKVKAEARNKTVSEAVSETLTVEQADCIKKGLLGIYRNSRLHEAEALKSAGRYPQAVEHYLRVASLDSFGVTNAGQGFGETIKHSDVFSDVFQAPGILNAIIMGANSIGADIAAVKELFFKAEEKERAYLQQYNPTSDREGAWASISGQIAEGLGGRSKWRAHKPE